MLTTPAAVSFVRSETPQAWTALSVRAAPHRTLKNQSLCRIGAPTSAPRQPARRVTATHTQRFRPGGRCRSAIPDALRPKQYPESVARHTGKLRLR